jgi:hypothetical protein
VPSSSDPMNIGLGEAGIDEEETDDFEGPFASPVADFDLRSLSLPVILDYPGLMGTPLGSATTLRVLRC